MDLNDYLGKAALASSDCIPGEKEKKLLPTFGKWLAVNVAECVVEDSLPWGYFKDIETEAIMLLMCGNKVLDQATCDEIFGDTEDDGESSPYSLDVCLQALELDVC